MFIDGVFGLLQRHQARLYELEVTHQFGAQELEAFKAIMMASADQLDEELWKVLDDKPVQIPFFCTTIAAQVQNPNDEWAFPLEARLKTLGVSSCRLQRTLYEKMLYGDEDPIAGVATQIVVPDELLDDMQNARQYICQQLGDTWQTTEQMKQTFRACFEQAKKLDGSVWMDLSFLENEFDELIERKLKRLMLEVLPLASEPPRAIGKACVAARTLASGDIALAQRKSLQNSLTGACRFLEDVSEGRGPTSEELGKMGDYLLQFSKRSEFCCVVVPDAVMVDGGKAAVQQPLYGADALRYRYDRCAAATGVRESADLREFRSFRWLLSEAEDAQFLNWERAAVHGAKARMKEAKA